MGQDARRLLEADLEEARLAATLAQRCEYLHRIAGVEVSASTVSRMLKRLGFSRKREEHPPSSAKRLTESFRGPSYPYA